MAASDFLTFSAAHSITDNSHCMICISCRSATKCHLAGLSLCRSRGCQLGDSSPSTNSSGEVSGGGFDSPSRLFSMEEIGKAPRDRQPSCETARRSQCLPLAPGARPSQPVVSLQQQNSSLHFRQEKKSPRRIWPCGAVGVGPLRAAEEFWERRTGGQSPPRSGGAYCWLWQGEGGRVGLDSGAATG